MSLPKTYAEKLKDPQWQKKRLEIMQRDRFECQGCGTSGHTLHVHHCYYLPRQSPWDYPDEALVTLCEDCHKERSEIDLSLRKHLGSFHNSTAGSLLDLLDSFAALGEKVSGKQTRAEFALTCALMQMRATWSEWVELKTAKALVKEKMALLNRIPYKRGESCQTGS